MERQRRSGSSGAGELRSPQSLTAGRPYFIASVLPLALGLVGLTPPLTGLIVGAAIAGFGAIRSLQVTRRRTRARRLADEQILSGALAGSSPLLGWRETELVSRSNRRVLARSLGAIPAESEALVLASPLNRRAVRLHLELVRALARRVGTLDEPVDPRGMVLVEQLICDGFGPLYARDMADELPRALDRCLSALEPRESSNAWSERARLTGRPTNTTARSARLRRTTPHHEITRKERQ